MILTYDELCLIQMDLILGLDESHNIPRPAAEGCGPLENCPLEHFKEEDRDDVKVRQVLVKKITEVFHSLSIECTLEL